MSLEHATGPDVTFGLFNWVDADGVREAGQLYRERLNLVADAEAHGFDVYHLAEHHGTPLGLAPSPERARSPRRAQRTTRIRLCRAGLRAAAVPPGRGWPRRSAMLDQLSGGRLEIGFGKGGNPYELLAYGIEAGRAQRRYDETLDAVLRALDTGVISADGAQMMPLRPRQLPHPPLWIPSSNPQSVARLGQRGINTILGFSFRSPWMEDTRRCRDEYFAGVAAGPGAAAGGQAGRCRGSASCATSTWASPTGPPGTGPSRRWASNGSSPRCGGSTAIPVSPSRRTSPAPSTRAGSSRVRPPPACRLTWTVQASGCNHVAGAFAFGSLTYPEARSSLARFAGDVAPALRTLQCLR